MLLYAGIFLLLKSTLENLKGMTEGKTRRKRINYAFGLAQVFAITCVMGYDFNVQSIQVLGE